MRGEYLIFRRTEEPLTIAEARQRRGYYERALRKMHKPAVPRDPMRVGPTRQRLLATRWEEMLQDIRGRYGIG